MSDTPDPIDIIRDSISRLDRAVNGDPAQGTKPLRQITEDLRTAIELIRSERADEKAERRGLNRALGFIFGTSLGSVIGVVILLINFFGRH